MLQLNTRKKLQIFRNRSAAVFSVSYSFRLNFGILQTPVLGQRLGVDLTFGEDKKDKDNKKTPNLAYRINMR